MNGLFEFEFGLIVWQIAILIIALFILGKYAWKPILSFIDKQEQAYAKVANEAEEQRQATYRLQKQNKEILKKANEEGRLILQKALESKKDLLKQTQIEVVQIRERVLTQAQKDILQEKKAVMEALKKQIGILVIQVAEKLLKQELSKKNKQDILLQTLIAQANANTFSTHKPS